MNILNVELYTRSASEPFSEDGVVRTNVQIDAMVSEHSIPSMRQDEPIAFVRIDFNDKPCDFLLQDLAVMSEDGEVLYSWDGGLDIFASAAGMNASPYSKGALIECLSSDPQLILPIAADAAARQATLIFSAATNTPGLDEVSQERLESLSEGQSHLVEAVQSVDKTTRRMLDKVLIEQDELAKGLLESRNASRNLGLALEARLAEAIDALSALKAIEQAVTELDKRLDERLDERLDNDIRRNTSLEGVIVTRVEEAESNIRDRIAHFATSSEELTRSLKSQIDPIAQAISTSAESLLEAISRSDQALAAEQRAHLDQSLAEAAKPLLSAMQDLSAETAGRDDGLRSYLEGRLTTSTEQIRDFIGKITHRLELQGSRAERQLDDQLAQQASASQEILTEVRQVSGQLDAHTEALNHALSDRVVQMTGLLGLKQDKLHKEIAQTRGVVVGLGASVADAVERVGAQTARMEERLADRLETLQSSGAGVADAVERVSMQAASIEDNLTRQLEALQSSIELVRAEQENSAAQQQTIKDLDLVKTQLSQAQNDLELIKAQLNCTNLPTFSVINEIGRLKAVAEYERGLAAALVSSTSWKITRPIRVIKRFMTTGKLRAPRVQATRSALAETGSGSDQDGPRSPRTAAASPKEFRTYVEHDGISAGGDVAARAIAFYLPQFHPIPENDSWWGEGFTEWTNVRRATPQFEGQIQPHVPGDLGYYDLRDPAVQELQAQLAEQYGISGFCFYFYWFGGKRLLEMPIETFANNKNINLPFCLCWANENWSRRWDGKDSEILIGQEHSDADDIEFIKYLSKYLINDRYIRVDGRPLVLVYRPGLLPNARETAKRWRAWCRENGIGEIHLAYTQSFEAEDPEVYGFDAAIEFPPNNTAPPVITDQVSLLNPDFSGIVYDYRVYPQRSESYAVPNYRLYRGVFPAWDNEARRTGRGTAFHHSSPALYRKWLENAIEDTRRRLDDPSSQLIFINAWNEWAEGAHLEPDSVDGYAYLQASREALTGTQLKARDKLVLVTHDAYRHGAQYLALNLARWFFEAHKLDLHIVILGDGPLKADFKRYGTVHDLAGVDPRGAQARELARQFKAVGVLGAICNTTVSGLFLETLAEENVACVALVHEMQTLIRDYGLNAHVSAICDHADKIIFPSKLVAESFSSLAVPPQDRALIRPQGLYKRNGAQTHEARQAARARLREHFGLSADCKVVVSVGFADLRKGVDLFVEIAGKVHRQRSDTFFLWVGDLAPSLAPDINDMINREGLTDRVRFIGFQEQTDDFFAGSDIYALTSREDPFPTVVMEALDVQVPAVMYEGAGGSIELVEQGGGLSAPLGDTDAFAGQILALLDDPDTAARLGAAGKQVVDTKLSFARYTDDLRACFSPAPPRVSVVIPNYNYARYLADRLQTVDRQSLRPYEIIVLDDASTDESLATLEALRHSLRTPVQVISNAINSGSVFKQWHKGVAACSGDVVWIAEADDLSEPDFLKAVVAAFEDPEVVLSYSQSKQIDENGSLLANNYLDYVSDIDEAYWLNSHKTVGLEEIRLRLSIRNTIPNVSGVVFRRAALLQVLSENLDEIIKYKNAGDWVTYVALLRHGKLAFCDQSLNVHRRHSGSVTLSAFNEKQLFEIISVQRQIASKHDVPPSISMAANRYVDALYQQFGLATQPGMTLAIDPRFRAIEI